MTGPLSYFIAVLITGFMLGILSLFVGLILFDTVLIGLGLSVIFVQAVIVAGLYKWVDRRINHSKYWIKDAVAARNAGHGTPQREAAEEFRPRLYPEDSQDREAPIVPRGLFYMGALLLLSSAFLIAYVWESPRLALVWLLLGITLYLINRFYVSDRSS